MHYMATIFTCVAEGESRSRSAVTPSVCPFVRPKILSSQLLWNYWSNYHETWYVDRTSYVVMHIGRKFWSPHFCGSYALWNLENTHKWPCHRNSSETTDPIFMNLGMKIGHHMVLCILAGNFWSPHFCWSYVPWNLENTNKWPFHCNSSETTDPFIMKLGM